MLDENELAEGKEYFRLGAVSVSQNGRYLAYSVDDNGSERFTARIKDLQTGELLPDTPDTLPPPPIEPTPDDPGGDPGGVPEPA